MGGSIDTAESTRCPRPCASTDVCTIWAIDGALEIGATLRPSVQATSTEDSRIDSTGMSTAERISRR